MHTVRARSLVYCSASAVSEPTSSWSGVASVGWFGLSMASGSVSQSPHAPSIMAGVIAIAASRISLRIFISILPAPSAVDPDRDHERARLRIVEVVDSLSRDLGPAEVRLRIDPRVVGPREQVAAGETQIEARQAEAVAHPSAVERVAEGDLAQLHEAAVLEELLRRVGEAAPRSRVPGLVDDDRRSRARPERRERGRPGAARTEVLSEGARLAANLGVAMRPEVVERALGAVPHLAALADVEESGELHL